MCPAWPSTITAFVRSSSSSDAIALSSFLASIDVKLLAPPEWQAYISFFASTISVSPRFSIVVTLFNSYSARCSVFMCSYVGKDTVCTVSPSILEVAWSSLFISFATMCSLLFSLARAFPSNGMCGDAHSFTSRWGLLFVLSQEA